MIYRPQKTERLWDSWLFEWDGVVHLFYLASHGGQGRIGHCTSTDLVHWQRRADLVLSHWPLTGMIIRHEGRFVMPLGEVVENAQTTTFYVSDDLYAWRRLPPDQYRLRPQGPHYATEPDACRPTAWWRDPFVFWNEDDDHYHAVVCAARAKLGPDDTGAALAHVRTRDFRQWQHLPPLDGPTGLFYHNEVPDMFVHDGRRYVLFSTGSLFGIRLNTPTRPETCGTYYMVGEALEGPYRLPQECLLVGAGYGRMSAYVGRTHVFGGERLLYHHVRDESGADAWSATWGAPKRLRTGPNGELRAAYWPGLEALETGEPRFSFRDRAPGWEGSGAAWHGRAQAAGTSLAALSDAADVHVRVDVTALSGGRCGLVLRASEGAGVLVSLDLDLGRLEIGLAAQHETAGWGYQRVGFIPGVPCEEGPSVIDSCLWPLQPGRRYSLRCLARAEHFEVYLDERWVFTAVIREAARRGEVHLFVERGEARFDGLRVAALAALERSESAGETRVAE